MPVTVTTDEDDNEITVESQSNAVLSISLFIREKKGGGGQLRSRWVPHTRHRWEVTNRDYLCHNPLGTNSLTYHTGICICMVTTVPIHGTPYLIALTLSWPRPDSTCSNSNGSCQMPHFCVVCLMLSGLGPFLTPEKKKHNKKNADTGRLPWFTTLSHSKDDVEPIRLRLVLAGPYWIFEDWRFIGLCFARFLLVYDEFLIMVIKHKLVKNAWHLFLWNPVNLMHGNNLGWKVKRGEHCIHRYIDNHPERQGEGEEEAVFSALPFSMAAPRMSSLLSCSLAFAASARSRLSRGTAWLSMDIKQRKLVVPAVQSPFILTCWRVSSFIYTFIDRLDEESRPFQHDFQWVSIYWVIL